MQDIENMGNQINNFYEKFGEIQNEIVAYEDEYSRMREEYNIMQGNTIQVENYGRGLTIRNIFNTNMTANEMLNKTQNYIGTKKQSVFSGLKRKKEKKQFFDDLEINDKMNNSMLHPTQSSSSGMAPNYTPENIIGTLSNMQDVQTDLNVDLIARSDSLMDIRSPPGQSERRARGNNKNKGSKSRSRSPMGASMPMGSLPQGNPYDYARPTNKGK